MTQKTKQKRCPKETSKNEAQGVPELIKHGSQFIEKSSKIGLNAKQTLKLAGQRFNVFFCAQNMLFLTIWDDLGSQNGRVVRMSQDPWEGNLEEGSTLLGG